MTKTILQKYLCPGPDTVGIVPCVARLCYITLFNNPGRPGQHAILCRTKSVATALCSTRVRRNGGLTFVLKFGSKKYLVAFG